MTRKAVKILFIAITLLATTWLIAMTDLQKIPNFSFNRLEKLHRVKGPLSSEDGWLLQFVNDTYLFPPSPEPYNLLKVNDRSYSLETYGNSWWYIHKYVRHLFTDEPPGVFLEAGALDGEFLSNTLWLEKTLGWTGLLIEPDKDSFRLLQKKHRKAWTSNACISKESYPMETYLVTPQVWDKKHELWANRMFYPANAHLLDTGSDQESATNFLPAMDHFSLVQCFPLITFVRTLGIETIDFLSLDLQGIEKVILRNFPWSKVNVRVVIIEDFAEVVDNDFIQFMEKINFQLMNRDDLPKSQDHIYINRDETRLIGKFKEWPK
ncbi:protein Star-like [Palaemon carinicauda]|uniref:protein Star-like n=1 Tax=Palaemon carinicauda TaxID=392227 RepID=UPI0035B57855